jgi:hypothetical protein
MILSSKFGYALRHQLKFHDKAKRGALTLWSYYDGSGIGTDPLPNGKNSLIELLAIQFAARGALFGGNYSAEFPLGSESDVFSILVAAVMVKTGKEFSFSNYQDRIISFSPQKVGQENQVMIIVKIRYSSKIGILTLEEVNELETVTKDIFSNLGYSKQDIIGKLEQAIAQSSNQVS